MERALGTHPARGPTSACHFSSSCTTHRQSHHPTTRAAPSPFGYVVSKPLGRSSYKEQYLFIYRCGASWGGEARRRPLPSAHQAELHKV